MGRSPELFRKRLLAVTQDRGARAELCRRTGLARSLVDKWARGEGSPGLESLDRIAEGLGVPPASLIEESEERPWEQVPRHLLLALADVDPSHYPIVKKFLVSFAQERERISKMTKGFEEPGRNGDKRRK